MTVGRYLLLTPIAEGGMAQIWLARQTGVKGFEKLVVVKRMVDTLETDPEHVEMFLSEARLAAQLDHPNVVQIFELGEDRGGYYIAMEYLDGENLSHLRRAAIQSKLFMPDVLSARVVAWAAEGLHYAHTRVGLDGKSLGVVHRDVSPQNLLVTYQGGLKVVDFGIAKLTSQHTNSGKLKGKIAYMSPEQARTEQVDARSDVFALGVVLFEQLSRSRLIGRASELEALKMMSGGEPFPLVNTRRGDIPEDLTEIVAKALERNAKDRYQSARDLQLALEAWIRTTGQSASSSDVADWMQHAFKDRIAERHRLMDAALKFEFSSDFEVDLKDIATGILPGSGSSRISKSRISAAQKPVSRIPAIIAGVAVTALLASWAAWATLRDPPSTAIETPVEVPREPVKPEPSVLAIDTQPSGAIVEVDGKPLGKAPVIVREIGVGEHGLEAKLEGYQPASRKINVERQGQRLDLTLSLVPIVKVDPNHPTGPKTTTTVRHAMGKLTLKTEPWTTVYLGNTKLGDTPLVDTPLPAGRQVLKLLNPESGIQSSIEVEIPANGTLVKKLKL